MLVISRANSAHSGADADEVEPRPMKGESVLVMATVQESTPQVETSLSLQHHLQDSLYVHAH